MCEQNPYPHGAYVLFCWEWWDLENKLASRCIAFHMLASAARENNKKK